MTVYYAITKKKGLERSGLKALEHYKIRTTPPKGDEDYILNPKRRYRLHVYEINAREGEITGEPRHRVVKDIPAKRVTHHDLFLTEAEEEELDEREEDESFD